MTKEQIKAYEEQLKPCPFCGKKPKVRDLEKFKAFTVDCVNADCGANAFVKACSTLEEAIEAWNKRGGEE